MSNSSHPCRDVRIFVTNALVGMVRMAYVSLSYMLLSL